MDIKNPWSPISIALSLVRIVWALTAYLNRNKYREPQVGLNKNQNTLFPFTPLLLAVLCIVLSTYIPNVTKMLPVYAMGIMFCLSSPFLRTSAEWVGVPLRVRQAATQIAWGVIIGFVFLILVSAVSDILGY